MRAWLWRIACSVVFEREAFRLKLYGLHLGECATWSIAAHQVALLRAELGDRRVSEEVLARIAKVEADFAKMASGAGAAMLRSRPPWSWPEDPADVARSRSRN